MLYSTGMNHDAWQRQLADLEKLRARLQSQAADVEALTARIKALLDASRNKATDTSEPENKGL